VLCDAMLLCKACQREHECVLFTSVLLCSSVCLCDVMLFCKACQREHECVLFTSVLLACPEVLNRFVDVTVLFPQFSLPLPQLLHVWTHTHLKTKTVYNKMISAFFTKSTGRWGRRKPSALQCSLSWCKN